MGLFAAIARAASDWNTAFGLNLLQVQVSPDPVSDSQRSLGDGISGLYFSQQISPTQGFGSQFGYTGTLRARNGLFQEADLTFNPGHEWLVYDGPLHYDTSGGRIAEMHRVALHEFGHLLGMAHPADDSVVTIMRSRMNDLFELSPLDLQDAQVALQNCCYNTRPLLRTFRHNSSHVTIIGTGNAFFTKVIKVQVTGASGSKTRRVRVESQWKTIVPITNDTKLVKVLYRYRRHKNSHILVRKKLSN